MSAENSVNSSPWSTEKFVRFLEARGQLVVRTSSACWYEHYRNGHIFMALPIQRCIAPGRAEIAEVFRQAPSAWFLRYAAVPRGEPADSFFSVCKPPYGIESLSAKVRKNTRRSLRGLNVRRITFREILEFGWEAHSDTMHRHREKASGFGLDASMDEFGAYAAWGAFSGDSLAAYAVTLTIDDWAHIRSGDRFLKLCPNNACVFFLCERLFASGYITAISYGLESIDALEGLDHFKASMGFRKEPVQQVVAVRPSMRPLLNRYTIAAALPLLKGLGLGGGRATRILKLISATPQV